MENRFLDRYRDIVKIRVKTRNTERFLCNLYKLKIDILDIKLIGIKELELSIYLNNLDCIKKISRLNRIDILEYNGKIKKINSFKFYYLFIIFLIFGLGLLIFLSNIVFNIEVIHSNKKVRDLVYSELNKYNIKKYTFVKSYNELQKIKENILDSNKDSIEWLEINRVGTKYIVKVEERNINGNIESSNCSNIVSKHNAVIKKIVVYSGSKMHSINEYVSKGEPLISSNIYFNDELKNTVKSSGSIYGEVWYKVSINYPIYYKYKTGNVSKYFNISFINDRKKYDNSIINRKYILKNNILPIYISYNVEEEISNTGIYSENEVLLNLIDYINNYLEKDFSDDEYIVDYKLLRYDISNNTISADIFYKLYLDISNEVMCDTI